MLRTWDTHRLCEKQLSVKRYIAFYKITQKPFLFQPSEIFTTQEQFSSDFAQVHLHSQNFFAHAKKAFSKFPLSRSYAGNVGKSLKVENNETKKTTSLTVSLFFPLPSLGPFILTPSTIMEIVRFVTDIDLWLMHATFICLKSYSRPIFNTWSTAGSGFKLSV